MERNSKTPVYFNTFNVFTIFSGKEKNEIPISIFSSGEKHEFSLICI